jgi:hypothetical protein
MPISYPSAPVKELQVNLGSMPKCGGSLVVTDASVTLASKVSVWLSAKTPSTGKGSGETEMDSITFSAVAFASGSFRLYWSSATQVAGPYVINYKVEY